MSEEEDKGTLNDGDNARAAYRSNDDGDGGQTDGGSLVNGNENATPCQLDIGLGTHTDSRRHDNGSNLNGKFGRP